MQQDKISDELLKLNREMLLRGFSRKTIKVYNYNLGRFLQAKFEHSKKTN